MPWQCSTQNPPGTATQGSDQQPIHFVFIRDISEHVRIESSLKTARDAAVRVLPAGTLTKGHEGKALAPLGTMKSWIRRGLQRLRACLEASEAA